MKTPARPRGRQADVLPELQPFAGHDRAEHMLRTGFWAMAARIPRMVCSAASLSWRANRVDAAAAIVVSLAAGILTAGGILATRDVLRTLIGHTPTTARLQAALPGLVVLASTVGIRSVLSIASSWCQARLKPRVRQLVGTRFLEIATSVELSRFDDPAFMDDMERARDRGAESSADLVVKTIDLAGATCGVGAAAVALTMLDPVLLPLLLLTVGPKAWGTVRAARQQYANLHARVTRQRRLWLLTYAMASRHSAAEIRSYGMQPFLIGEHERVLDAELDSEIELARKQSMVRVAAAVLAGLASAAAYLVLCLLVGAGQLPVAIAGTAVLGLQTAQAAVAQAITAINGLYEASLYASDYEDFCTREAPAPPQGPRVDARPLAELRLENVTLRYRGASQPALDGVSLTIQRGEVIALVGENGSGKTSLARVLAGLYRPTSGRLLWNGHDVAGLDRSMHDRVTIIAQDYNRWPFTARANIQLTSETSNEGRLQSAARRGVAHDMITQLPNSYDTLLDATYRDGVDLSGGQWQRIALARGFYRERELLICDEPSAALDARAERQLFDALLAARGEQTIVLITHRLANIRHADSIVVLKDGHIVERGSHRSLLDRGGHYAYLFHLQADAYGDADESPNVDRPLVAARR